MQKLINGTLRCSGCEQRKDVIFFSRNKATRTGYAYRCRECTREKRSQWMQKLSDAQLALYRESIMVTAQKWRARVKLSAKDLPA